MDHASTLVNPDAFFEDLGRRLYVEAQIDIPPDVREALRAAAARESLPGPRGILTTMLKAMDVSDRKQTLVCQDTGIPIFWITIGRGITIDGAAMIDALRRGVERATRETPLRSSIVSPIRRENRQTSSGDGGFNSIFVDTTYTSRYLGKHIGMGLDWLDGYPGLQPGLKKEAMELLVRWSDYTRDEGYMNESPASNYEAGAYVSRVLTALALAKRHREAEGLVERLAPEDLEEFGQLERDEHDHVRLAEVNQRGLLTRALRFDEGAPRRKWAPRG